HLVAERRISASLGAFLSSTALDYIDAVDNGRVAPKAGIPCFPRIVEAITALATTEEEYDVAFDKALSIAGIFLEGLVAEHRRIADAEQQVLAAMASAVERG